MKYLLALVFVNALATFASSQDIKLIGTIYDPNGAVVVNGQVKAVGQSGRSKATNSNFDGRFELNLTPGIYALDISAPGFLTVKYNEFLIVSAARGSMSTDFVLFAGKYHEPCGYSGASCPPTKLLIRSYELKYTPALKNIRKEFDPNSRKGETRPK